MSHPSFAGGPGGFGADKKKISITQLHDSINETELMQMRAISLFPELGQNIVAQY